MKIRTKTKNNNNKDFLAIDKDVVHETIALQMFPANSVFVLFYHNPQSFATLLPSKWSPNICIPPSNIISLLSVITPEHSITNINEHTAEKVHTCDITHPKIKRKSNTKGVGFIVAGRTCCAL